MADLDAFFAKKDKKKKSKTKFLTQDEIFKKHDETVAKKDEQFNVLPKKEKPVPPAQPSPLEEGEVEQQGVEATPTDVQVSATEEEWTDFQVQGEVDYASLKIQVMQIGEVGYGDQEDNDDDMELNEDGERVPKKEGGPWNKMTVSQNKETEESEPAEPAPKPVPVEPEQPPQTKSSYVPPHLRRTQQQQQAGPARGPGVQVKKKNAPDISSEIAFPTLESSTVPDPTGAWTRKLKDLQTEHEVGFEEVRPGRGHIPTEEDRGQKYTPLALTNQFEALEGDDS